MVAHAPISIRAILRPQIHRVSFEFFAYAIGSPTWKAAVCAPACWELEAVGVPVNFTGFIAH
jgi:hypothetical protein